MTDAVGSEQQQDYAITPIGGRLPLFFAAIFLVAAAGAYLYAEAAWLSVSGSSIGVGTSAYHSVLFERAEALAAVSIACGVYALLQRTHRLQ